MNKQFYFGLFLVTLSVILGNGLIPSQSATACGKCWNVTAGEPLEVIGIDQTGDDAGYAIKRIAP